MTWHFAQAPCPGGGTVWQRSSECQGHWLQRKPSCSVALGIVPPYARLGTGSHQPHWQALSGDVGLASAYLLGLSGRAQTALGKFFHKWVLGRLCQTTAWGEEGGAGTRPVGGLCCAGGLPPSHFMKFSEADLTPGSGVGPTGHRVQSLETLLSGFKSQLPHI